MSGGQSGRHEQEMQACLASFSELSLAGLPEFAVGAVPFSAMSLIRWPWPVGSRGSDAEVVGGFHRTMLAFGAADAAVDGMLLVAAPAGGGRRQRPDAGNGDSRPDVREQYHDDDDLEHDRWWCSGRSRPA